MSVRGLADSARIWARISPADFRAMFTRMPVSRWKPAAIASHQSAAGAHSMLSVPCAAAGAARLSSRAPVAAMRCRIMAGVLGAEPDRMTSADRVKMPVET